MKYLKRKINKLIKKGKKFLSMLLVLGILAIASIFIIGLTRTIVIISAIVAIWGVIKIIKKYSKTKHGRKSLSNYVIIFISLIGIIGILFTGTFLLYVIKNAPNFNPENLYKKEATILYDNENNIFAKLGTEKREEISYDDLPQVLIDAIIATEDSRYYQHNGFDLPRFLKASLGQLTGNKDAGGASTLSMQVVRNNFTSTDQSILRKFTDIYLAIFKLEQKYTKEQILEFYVNIPYLGSGSYGVEQACQTYFNKSVRDINLAEASLLAGMFQAPGAYDPFINPASAKNRQKTVLYLMEKHGYINEKERQIVANIPIETLINGKAKEVDNFQGYIDTVVEEVRTKTGYNPYNTPMKIYTNLDTKMQLHINDIMSGKAFTFANDVVQTGIAVVGVRDGKILAVGANRNLGDKLSYNFATMIRRQPGSTIKPFFDYGPGMEYNNWSTYTPFLDQKYSYSNGKPINNWDSKYMGLLTLRQALDQSRNIPALKAFQSVNNKKIIQFAQSVGLEPEIDGGKIHEAHAIGGYNGTSPVELAGAFAALGNGGYFIEPYSVSKIEYRETGMEQVFSPKKERVMSDSTAFMLTDILRESVSSGFNTNLRIPGVNIAAKSGTTNFDDKTKEAYKLPDEATNDVWAVGYSPDYVVSLWYGYEKISNKYYNTTNTGFTVRGKLFKAIGEGIFKKDNKKFEVPNSVIKVPIEKDTIPAMLASEFTPNNMIVYEYFKKGTEPTEISPRFNRLTANVNNLDAEYDSNTNSFILTWDQVNTPAFLTDNYFITHRQSILKNYTNTYLEKYKTYNANNLGTLGYYIYSKDDTTGELTLLKFTTDNSYNAAAINNTMTFVVKTGFSIFKDSQSLGSEITVTANIENPITISLYGDETITIPVGGTYSKYSQEVIVMEGTTDVTSLATISEKIFNLADNSVVDAIDTSTVATYRIDYSVKYKTLTEIKSRTIVIIEP